MSDASTTSDAEHKQRAAARLALRAWSPDMDRAIAQALAVSAFGEQAVRAEFARNPIGATEREVIALFNATMTRLVSMASDK